MRKLEKYPLWEETGKEKQGELSPRLQENLARLAPYLEKNDDLICTAFSLQTETGELRPGGVVLYLDEVVDGVTLHEHVLKPLRTLVWNPPEGPELEDICQRVIQVAKVQMARDEETLLHALFDGMAILMLEGQGAALSLDIHGGKLRSIEEPPTEKAISGPREGFIENFDVNISMLRRRLRDPHLVVHKMTVGRRTHTGVALVYLEDVADPGIVRQVEERINRLDLDGILAADAIAQLLEEHPWSFFPQFRITERADKAAAGILEGRIALVVAGTPQVLFIPSLFTEFLQASEDYYERSLVGSYIRLLRVIALVTSLSFPALYIAVTSFHPELIPFRFLIPVAEARADVPFPVLFEMLLQEGIIQLVIEAGLRLPGSVGQTVGVVAGVVLGQAAISARIASPVVIIVIAVTTVSTFSLPSQPLVQATRILRLPLLLLTGLFGLYGFSMGWLLLLSHLAGIENFGVPYLAPVAPGYRRDWKDQLVRAFLWKMARRPEAIPGQQKWRQARPDQEGAAHGAD